MTQDKLYVLVRQDLSKSQQAVQAGHALAELLLETNPNWNNGTLVYLGVRDKEELDYYYEEMDIWCLKRKFNEPYKDMGHTAFAAIGKNVGEKLKDLTLLKL